MAPIGRDRVCACLKTSVVWVMAMAVVGSRRGLPHHLIWTVGAEVTRTRLETTQKYARLRDRVARPPHRYKGLRYAQGQRALLNVYDRNFMYTSIRRLPSSAIQ